VNLFQSIPEGQGGLTAALLALLEHCGSDLANALMRKAGIPHLFQAESPPQVAFPAPDSPPGQGLVSGRDFALRVVAQAPGESWDPAELQALEGPALAVTLTGKAPPGVHVLSWEQVDRVLAFVAEQHDPQSRTGFLVRQFRDFLPRAGIESFSGFSPEELDGVPAALATLTRFLQTADQLFQRLAPALGEAFPLLRQARPEDLLAGYCYRDFGGAALGDAGFLRIALHVPGQELQVAVWSGNESSRIQEALQDEVFLDSLRELGEDPLLWLWSAGGEQKIALAKAMPEQLAALNWSAYQAGFQRSLPFEHLAGDGLVGRVSDMAQELLETLAPLLAPVVH
jgi:hypothetical protein